MLPKFEPDTGNLPPGMHVAPWDEFTARFGYTPHRLSLLTGLKAALDALQVAGCRHAYMDGSFVTDKEVPGDFDACWDVDGVDGVELRHLAPELLDFSKRRDAQKAALGGDLFPADLPANPAGTVFLDYFQRDRHSGRPKGIVMIDLGSLP